MYGTIIIKEGRELSYPTYPYLYNHISPLAAGWAALPPMRPLAVSPVSSGF